ncbi:sulfite exporter TauE/SafE family protein [Ectothiorhodospiraceae bacterium 2226]|nr:sulfite exporter TauE/SafE family protein [Ectothiorhodospiraceae bacterium 2226]
MTLFLYLMIGALAGTLAGLLGVGGGLVVVPALAFLFAAQEVDAGVIMHLALGTSLATIVVTAASSSYAHHRRGAVLWDVVARLTPGLVVGVFVGALMADHLPTRALTVIVGLFALSVAAQMAFGAPPRPHRTLPGTGGQVGAGALIGGVSAFVGIGGGSLTVPYLAWCNIALQRAVATSAACGLPIALAGALGYMAAGRGAEALPAGSTGYVYWPAFIGIAFTSLLFAPLGARFAHALPTRILKRVFALVLALVGLRMLLW